MIDQKIQDRVSQIVSAYHLPCGDQKKTAANGVRCESEFGKSLTRGNMTFKTKGSKATGITSQTRGYLLSESSRFSTKTANAGIVSHWKREKGG